MRTSKNLSLPHSLTLHPVWNLWYLLQAEHGKEHRLWSSLHHHHHHWWEHFPCPLVLWCVTTPLDISTACPIPTMHQVQTFCHHLQVPTQPHLNLASDHIALINPLRASSLAPWSVYLFLPQLSPFIFSMPMPIYGAPCQSHPPRLLTSLHTKLSWRPSSSKRSKRNLLIMLVNYYLWFALQLYPELPLLIGALLC